ncbi:MAG: AgmX/PglI C-terminal domain-containing protein [Myxococcota bacterium]
MRRLPLLSLACLTLLAGCQDDTQPSSDDDVRPSAAGGGATVKLNGKCDATKLTALAGSVDAAPDKGPELVAKQLGDACELHPAIAVLFERNASTKGSAASTKVDLSPETAKVLSDALATVCPGASVIQKQLADEPGAKRMGLMYERCNFGRFDLMAKEAWLRGEPSSAIPFFAYQWLTDEGASEAQAQSLARAMLLLDRRQWARDDQQLPNVTQALAAVPEGTVLYVTPSTIVLDEREVVSIRGGAIDEPALRGHLIEPLHTALSDASEQAKELASKRGETWPGRLVLVADGGMSQGVLVDIMFTAGRANFSKYAFVAQSGPHRTGAVRSEQAATAADRDSGAAFHVEITKAGYKIFGEAFGQPPAEAIELARTKDGALDLAALAAEATKYRAANETGSIATVYAEENVEFRQVVPTLATLRGPECERGGECIFDEVTVAAEQHGPARYFDPEMMARSGILGMLAAEGGGGAAFGGTFGATDEDVWGGLIGEEIGAAGGLGLSGIGEGGGGSGSGIGLGSVGTIGPGGGGYGSGSGAGFGGRSKRVPRVRQAKAKVVGSLDKDIIRRIVRAHVNEVRSCYDKGLADDPTLAGKLSIDFTINATGKIDSASVNKDELSDDKVGKCVVKAVKRWKFPRPKGGGIVKVTYPFVLAPS